MANYDAKFVEDSSTDITSPQRDVEDGVGDTRVIDPDSGVKRGLKNRHLSRSVQDSSDIRIPIDARDSMPDPSTYASRINHALTA
jgi:hypothetical protein